MDTPFIVNEPYRCRLKYLFAGLRHRAKSYKQHSDQQFAKPWIGALLLAPFLVILLMGLVVGKTAQFVVALSHAPGASQVGYGMAIAFVLGVLSLPFVLGYRFWKFLRQACCLGWELSHQVPESTSP